MNQGYKLRIESDFIDYYDKLSSQDVYMGVYYRYKANLMNKVQGLEVLRRIGVKTIRTEAANRIYSKSGKVIVYTDINAHDGRGKHILREDEACLIHPNMLASEFYEEADGYLNKLIHIGKRRFRVILKSDKYSLDEGNVKEIKEVAPGYNMVLRMPIYSIDYIHTYNGMLAITLHNVEQLGKYGIDKILPADEAIKEVFLSMLKYGLMR